MKVQPHSKELERAVLGAILVDKNALGTVLEIVSSSDFFYEPKHQVVFEAIMSLYAKNDDIDILTVVDELNRMDNIQKAGGPAAVFELMQKVNSALHIDTHCRKLQEAYMKRKIILTADKLLEKAYEPMTDALELLTDTQTETLALTDLLSNKSDQTMMQILRGCIDDLDAKFKNKSDVTGIASPVNTLNKITAGWQDSDLIILAARPGAGKTAFALSEALHACLELKLPVGFISCEMGAKQLVNRLISNQSLINSNKIRRPTRMDDADWARINHVIGRMSHMPFYIDDETTNIMQVKSKATKWKAKYDIKFLIIDYLQLLKDTSVKGNREQEIASITRNLKQLAKSLNIPVMALSQLSRAVEQRTDKRPMLSDLRESGAIEQDADLVAFLYREEYYNPNCDPDEKNKTEIIIAKHRNGSLNTVIMDSDLATTRYADVGTLNFNEDATPAYNVNAGLQANKQFEEETDLPF